MRGVRKGQSISIGMSISTSISIIVRGWRVRVRESRVGGGVWEYIGGWVEFVLEMVSEEREEDGGGGRCASTVPAQLRVTCDHRRCLHRGGPQQHHNEHGNEYV